MMDTSQRITALCDGDKHLIYQDLEDYSQVTIEALQTEYLPYMWLEKGLVVVMAIGDTFTPTINEMSEAFMKSMIPISIPFEPKNVSKDGWQRAWKENINNYRKLHHLPLIRRPRCRWRPRESRRSLNGLSPGIVIIDEYAFSDEHAEGE